MPLNRNKCKNIAFTRSLHTSYCVHHVGLDNGSSFSDLCVTFDCCALIYTLSTYSIRWRASLGLQTIDRENLRIQKALFIIFIRPTRERNRPYHCIKGFSGKLSHSWYYIWHKNNVNQICTTWVYFSDSRTDEKL